MLVSLVSVLHMFMADAFQILYIMCKNAIFMKNTFYRVTTKKLKKTI